MPFVESNLKFDNFFFFQLVVMVSIVVVAYIKQYCAKMQFKRIYVCVVLCPFRADAYTVYRSINARALTVCVLHFVSAYHFIKAKSLVAKTRSYGNY